MSRLQLLTTKFENLKIRDEETINEINTRLCNIANEGFSLGEKMSEEKLMRNILRSLSKRFAYQVTATEEAKVMRNMKLEELIGFLQTFEMNFEEERAEKKSKGIALKSEAERVELKSTFDEDEDLVGSIIRLTQNLGQVMKSFTRSFNGGIPQRVPGAS